MGRADISNNVGVAITTGALVGLLLGFIDTYGYAVTGYTTSELAPIVSAILSLPLLALTLRRAPTPLEHLVSIVVATGISLSTAITSGMYITYTMLKHIDEGMDIPSWLYLSSRVLSINSFSFYLYAAAVSISGIFLAYVFHSHFIDKERLPYPIGLAFSMIVSLGRFFSRLGIALPVLTGLGLQVLLMWLGTSSLDITAVLQHVVPGSALALSTDLFIYLLALLIPLNTSVGVGLGNVIMYLVITPILTYLGLMHITTSMSSSSIALEAAPYTASIIVGFIAVATTYYIITSRNALLLTLKFILGNKLMIRRAGIAVALLASLAIPLYTLVKPSLTLTLALPSYLLLHIVLALITVRVVGETGTASQATLPIATFTLFTMGARKAMTYVLLDPYTGVPMPQFLAGASMNVFKGAKKLGVDADLILPLLSLSVLLGAPITLLYGHYLLLAYGLNSPKLNLLRWVPVVTWMSIIYRGDASSFNTYSIVLGIILAIALIVLFKLVRLGGISVYSILLGLTLTPDMGLIFLLASIIKYIALRVGIDVYESLLTYSSLMLAGSGIGIAAFTVLSLMGVT